MRQLATRAPRRRGLTEGDRAAWADYAQRVTPLPGVAPEVAAEVVVAVVAEPAMAPMVRAPVRRLMPVVVGAAPAGVDTASWTRFRSGKLGASRTLDLHGRTAQRAYVALEHFLHSAVGDGVRCVEVITGRGKGEAGGVIRREFPLWLNQPHLRHLILAAAHPHALNPGSVRLLLRRARP